jgi:hypothetical protein
MTYNNPTEFVCPGCGSGYKVVRVEADADLPHRLLHCRVCKHPLTAMDGEFLLKYFLVRPSEKDPAGERGLVGTKSKPKGGPLGSREQRGGSFFISVERTLPGSDIFSSWWRQR